MANSTDSKVVAVPLEGDELNGTNPYKDLIPSRIHCNVLLQVRDSPITGAGRAVFALQDVKIGEVIFRIPNPLVAVPDFEDGLRICDNCFACEEQGGVMTVPNAGIKFSSCKECRTVLYCDETCQREAWKHHYKFECGFRKVFAKAPSLRARISGLTQRLAFMRANNKISNDEWAEIRTLFRGKITEDLGSRLERVEGSMNSKAAMFASFAKDTGKIELSEVEIRQLGIAMANYAWTAHVPTFGIDQGCTLECQLPAQIATGWFFDPFPALVNHSCQPSAFYFCNGKEMVAVALEDIQTGGEVTYCYNYEPVQDYESRRSLLSNGFGFDCTCKLCQKGDLSPQGELSNRVQFFIGDGPLAIDVAEIEVIEELIEDMKTAGFNLKSGHMYQLQKCAARAYITTKSFRRFLKAYLTMFTIAFNLQPPGSPYRFIGSRWALAIMNPFLQATRPGAGAEYWGSARLNSPETMSLVTLLDQIWLQLLEVHVDDLSSAYGEDAPIVEVARLNLETKQKTRVAGDGAHGGIPPGDSSIKDKNMIVVNVNKLLEWAGLPARSREEILGNYSGEI
ncbi:hypothetical protein DL95DRAFT_462760 [Leptodontidium sp. 2 PMI_412]|nr:hypothetical protein DL95DRAFT_462760 [Leptodontidium sp. 2 PMI_412]